MKDVYTYIMSGLEKGSPPEWDEQLPPRPCDGDCEECSGTSCPYCEEEV